jgi:hypothetical protein
MTQTTNRYRHTDEVDGALRAAARIVPEIFALTGPVRSVVDVGGGTGAWLSAFLQQGAQDVTLHDSTAVADTLLIPQERFYPVDLSQTMPPEGRYDLAVCVECAEHLPATRARPLVSWLTRSADRVVFSAAISYQGGKGHINEQPQTYWRELFAEHGFACRDLLRGRILHDQSVPWWYRQNLFLYTAPNVSLASECDNFISSDFHLVHENVRERLEHPGVRRSSFQLASAIIDGIRRSLRIK